MHQGATHRPFEVTAFDSQSNRFFQLASDLTTGSRDCRVATVDNFAYVARVVCGSGTLATSLLRFDPRNFVSQELRAPRILRLEFAMASLQSKRALYVFGGVSENGGLLSTAEYYEVLTNTWCDITPFPVAVFRHAASSHNESVYITGGLEGPQNRYPAPSLRRFDPLLNAYTQLAPMLYARRGHEMVTLNDSLYVCGGIAPRDVNYQSSSTPVPIETYNIATDQWSLVNTGTLLGRAVGHFVIMDGCLFSIGREHSDAAEEEVRRCDVTSSNPIWLPYARTPRRSGLAGVYTVSLRINFHDDRVAKHVISESN